MKLCHTNENVADFQHGRRSSSIEIIELTKGETSHFFSELNQIVFVQTGTLFLSSNKTSKKRVRDGEAVLIPEKRNCRSQCEKSATVLVMKFHHDMITFCDRLPLDSLVMKYEKTKKESVEMQLLKPNKKLINFSKFLIDSINSGLKCPYYFDIKVREFVYLIRMYYDNHIVLNFFKPIYSGDFSFINNVNKNLDKVRTLRELSDILNYSLSGFEKKFKRVFKVAPYRWIQEQRAEKVHFEISCSKKTFSEIAFELGFSSPAHFNEFCRKRFGNTPGGIRKENREQLVALIMDQN